MFGNAAFLAIGSFGLLILGYYTYGRFISRRIFRLDPRRTTPAHTLKDGIDYLPTRIPILFGHHFASIAGLGPILGPAIAVIWGWGPALLWVLIGSVFIGAVHDLGALVMSLRCQGRSIGEVCDRLIGFRARLLALLIIFFLMALAMGAFCNAIADLFVNYNPDAIVPSVGLMVVAVIFGFSVYRIRVPLALATVVALTAFAGLILLGVEKPVLTHEWFASAETRAALDQMRQAPPMNGQKQFKLPYGAVQAVEQLVDAGNVDAARDIGDAKTPGSAVWKANYAWIAVLLGYGFLASVLPVWLLLQPRDYINSFQLYFTLAAMTLGLVIAAMVGAEANRVTAPAFRMDVPGAPPVFPFLFVTIACGAVSGFHSLVSSGTTVKQLNRETDARPIGYGAMLVEAALAVLVILACVAGLDASSWREGGAYATWAGIGGGGLAVQLNAMFRGGANFLAQLGIPVAHGRTVLAVTVVAFALTTLDSATRLLRFNVQELGNAIRFPLLGNRFVASAIAVTGIAFFALVPAGKTLWILFGTMNQLLAGLTLLTASVFLFKLRRAIAYTMLPMAVMLVMSIWAMVLSLMDFWAKGQWSLAVVTVVVLAMSVWLMVEAVISFCRGRDGFELDDEPDTVPPEKQAALDASHLG